MSARKKASSAKKPLNLNNQILFIGGQAYRLKKVLKHELKKGVGESALGEEYFEVPDHERIITRP